MFSLYWPGWAGLLFAQLATAAPHTKPQTRDFPSSISAELYQGETFHPYGTINNSYIVMFKPGIPQPLRQNHLGALHSAQFSVQAGGLGTEDSFARVTQVYDGHVMGYAGQFSPRAILHIQAMPEVDFVEQDQFVRTMDVAVQKGAPWGLARISHRDKLDYDTYTRYIHDPKGGEGVDVYVIDTGININHVEFEGRAEWGKTMPLNDKDEDANGHGTHCAGIIASRKYGVAKAAKVIAVKVIASDGIGSMSDVIGGVVWAVNQSKIKAELAKKEVLSTGRSSHRGSVANLSLGGGKSRALDDTVNRAVDSGLHFAVAAGNDNQDACDYSPSRAEKVITVGATNMSDHRAYFSNYGACVDVFAPGVDISSTHKGSKTAFRTLSGTSMASPHVAGLVAYLLSLENTDFKFGVPSGELSTRKLLGQNFPTAKKLQMVLTTAFRPSNMFPLPTTPPIIPVNVSRYLPSPQRLRETVLLLSTQGVLSELPERTSNLLIFNNATL